jgi:hypothetical protein
VQAVIDGLIEGLAAADALIDSIPSVCPGGLPPFQTGLPGDQILAVKDRIRVTVLELSPIEVPALTPLGLIALFLLLIGVAYLSVGRWASPR